ncbi:hypothetical protein VNO78_12534 [Psophocarpus tetragonolobus]|uniref:Uncharacterized protein n=1 Tax=Psophocarpus tetragonolobus TaxID=3891 RepID=A0AAN9SR53_PSOTE
MIQEISYAWKVRTKLFMAETLNNEDDLSNEQGANDYFQDEGSTGFHNVLIDDKEIQLFDANSPMEDINQNYINFLVDNIQDDEFINNNEHNEEDELTDEDEFTNEDQLTDEDVELDDADERLDDSNNNLDYSDEE